MLYDSSTGKHFLSIFGSSDMRAYYEYELGSADYTSDLYYSEVFNGQLVAISTPATMGYPYVLGHYTPLIHLIDKGA